MTLRRRILLGILATVAVVMAGQRDAEPAGDAGEPPPSPTVTPAP